MEFPFIQGFLDGIRPEPRLTVSEWADAYRKLSPNAASEPGPWRTERTPYLKMIMDCLSVYSPYQKVVVMKGAQLGFALDIETPIPTPEGWATMGKLKQGDTVFDEAGKPCKVTFATEVMHNHKCYDVYFSDGSIIKADEHHLWEVWDEKKWETRKKKVINTKEIAQTFKHRNRNRYAIDVAKPIETETKNLIVKPYTLGVWLGDGNSYSNRITTHSNDVEEMFNYIKAEGHYAEIDGKHAKGNCKEIALSIPAGYCQRGHDLHIVGQTKQGRCAECHRRRSNKDELSEIIYPKFGDLLWRIGVLREKHIPTNYLRADFNQRLALLQGLMDTDGHIREDGFCEWYSCDKRLTDDVVELIASLGLKPKIRIKKGGKENKILEGKTYISNDVYVITFHSYKEYPVARLERKKSRLKSETDCRSSEINRRRITNVVEVESIPVKCIQVDSPSHLYLAGKTMIPTHNTEAGNNWIGYIIDNSPAPTLMVQPTDDTVKRNSKMRIDPMIQDSESLSKKVATRKSRSGENTITQKNFPGGILLMAGANSPVGLRSVPIRNLFLDEVDGYPYDLEGEGSPIELAIARTRTFAKRKIFIISTPTVANHSAIEREFLKTDQHYYNVPCPQCGDYHVWMFENLTWEEGKPSTAKMKCPSCGDLYDERHKKSMMAHGMWMPSKPELTSDETIGFHLSSFYSPKGWFSWKEIAATYEDAKNDPSKTTTFINTVLGEPLVESGESPDWENLYNRRETYAPNFVPYDVCFLTSGVDIQKDRIELEIVGWCADKSSYSIDFRVLEGNTSLPDVWNQLAEIVNETWMREDGIELQILRMAVDSGYNTSEVHKFCRNYVGRVVPIKGQDRLGLPVAPPRQVDVDKKGKKIGKLKQWNIGVSLLKAELYSWIVIQPNEDGTFPPCYCHFPQYDRPYFEGLTAEDWIPSRQKWVKKYQRNEPLDCRIYARAASVIVGLDRMKPEQLKALSSVQERRKPIARTEPEERTERKRKKSSFWD